MFEEGLTALLKAAIELFIGFALLREHHILFKCSNSPGLSGLKYVNAWAHDHCPVQPRPLRCFLQYVREKLLIETKPLVRPKRAGQPALSIAE